MFLCRNKYLFFEKENHTRTKQFLPFDSKKSQPGGDIMGRSISECSLFRVVILVVVTYLLWWKSTNQGR